MDEKYVPYRLNLDHLAFYRAWMEGTFELESLAERYLETGTDRPAAKRTLKAVQDTLVAVARRKGKHGQARLLMLSKEALRAADSPPPSSDQPSFDDYLAEKDPDGAFGIQEMWEMYQAEFEPTPDDNSPAAKAERRRQERNARLAKRRSILIAELVNHLSVPPKASDLIDGWFDESVAKPLVTAGYITIGQVAELANDKGFLWYKSVPRMGPTRAARLTEWFKRHNDALDNLFTPFALTPKRLLPKEERLRAALRRRMGDGGGDGPIAFNLGQSPNARAVAPMQPSASSPFAASQDGLYLPPAELDGSQGANRAPVQDNRSGANNDFEAIQAWLNLYKDPQQKHTLRAYRTSVERLLLWCVMVKHKALSSLTTQDVMQYKEFLADPKPYDQWVSEDKHPRFHPDWRPFIWRRKPKAQRFLMAAQPEDNSADANIRRDADGNELIAGLSPESVKYAIVIATKLCSWLVSQRYLDYNPFVGLARKKSGRTQINVGRSLTKQQWDYVMRYAQSLPEDDPKTIRMRFVLHLAFSTGLRLSELVAAKTGDISIQDLGDDVIPMVLRVLGKGNELREVFLPQSLQRTLAQYLRSRGLPDDPRACPPDTPLIAKIYSTRWGDAISTSALYTMMTEFFIAAANAIPDAETTIRGREDRYRLMQASTHWLRHTHGTHAAARGTDIDIIKQNLGHKSLATTSVYVKAEARLRAEQMEAFDQAVFGTEE